MAAPVLGVRHVQTALLYFSVLTMYMGRLNVSVTVVAMTDAASANPDFQEFKWTEQQKGYVLSSFYWGYLLTQFLGSDLCRRFGTKPVIVVALVVSSLLSIFTPMAAMWGDWPMFCVIRVVQGLFQGVVYPAIFQHLAKWSPPAERNRLGAFTFTGIDSGTVLGIFTGGVTAASSLGWPGVSYISGGACLLVCLFWMIFGASNPTESRWISKRELDFIESSMERTEDFHKTKIPVPWKAMMTSVPVWAMLIAYGAHCFGFASFHSELPSFMHGILHMQIEKSGLFSALPFLVMWLMSFVFLISSDVCLNRKILSLTSVRRIINSIASCVPAVGLFVIGFLDRSSLIIALFTLSVGMNSGATIGCDLNGLDLTPNHAGTLMAVASTVGNIVGIITPIMFGFIVTDTSNASQWRIAFGVTSVIFLVGNTFYVMCSSTKVQPWDDPDYMKSKKGNTPVEMQTIKDGANKTLLEK